MRSIVATACVLCLIQAAPTASAQSRLADYFGFDDVEFVKIGRNAGPIAAGDLNGDGNDDLIVVNNYASRIEVHFQKPNATPDDPVVAPVRVNEFPDHWRFRSQQISVTHRVAAVIPLDYDRDGLMDLIYAGYPSEIVFVRQTTPGTFKVTRKHRVKNLAATRTAFSIADVQGDDRPEILAIVGGEIHIFPFENDRIEEPTPLIAGANMIAFDVADFDGDDLLDVVGIIPDDTSPIRIWLGSEESGSFGGQKALSAELRFEMPAIRECISLDLGMTDVAQIAVIEKGSKRVVTKRLRRESIAAQLGGDASLRVFNFPDGENRQRDHAVIDLDGDGLLDLIATDTKGNAVVMYRQVRDRGLVDRHEHPSLSDLDSVVVGNVDDDPAAEIFVLSEKEGVVGRSDVDGTSIPFPSPINVSDGFTPVCLALVELADGPVVAVIGKDGRDHVIDLIDMDGQRDTIELGALSRAPDTILDLDADQDGRTDLLLFTRDKPMTMLQADSNGFTLRESKDMGQYGLVKAAAADNTSVYDVDRDGKPELLIAEKNFVRAVRYESDPAAGVSPGWQVVRQMNTKDSSSKLVALATVDGNIYAADDENDRLVVFTSDSGAVEDWDEREAVGVTGFSFNAIHAGAFSGDREANILAVGDAGFSVIRLAGERYVLEDTNVWRTDDDRRLQHELQAGDLNNDGFMDLVSLDAGEQMCELFTFSESGTMLYATGFKVFESRLFTGGEGREYEPSQTVIADVTGDGAADLILLAHDRVLIYPQSAE
ncbi:MAG: VCBS repeat-containing protein [Planctomycetota bacterium]